MKKFEFKMKYENWNLRQGLANISQITLDNDFQLMIKSEIEALDWVRELLEQHPTWLLIILANALYERHNIERPSIPLEHKGKLKQLSKIHIKQIKNLKVNG